MLLIEQMARAGMVRSKTKKTLTDIQIFDMLFLYDMMQCLGIEAMSSVLYDQIRPKLIGSNIY